MRGKNPCLLGFRQPQETIQRREARRPRPEQPRLGAPIPRRGTEHAWDDDSTDDVHDLIRYPREDDGLLAQAGAGDLADERVADGAQGGIVYEVERNEHGADREVHLVGFGCKSKAADDEEHYGHQQHPEGVERAAAENGDHCEPLAEGLVTELDVRTSPRDYRADDKHLRKAMSAI